MAIIGPESLPIVLKVDSQPLKSYAISQLGHPVVMVEVMEDQFEKILKVTGDFIAQYFYLEEKYAFFMTQPLQAEYPLPHDAYWIRDVKWDPATTRIDQIFGAESFLFNIGNITGIQNLLTDYHLLQAYRKFSQRLLGNEGQWEFKVEQGTIRLFPIPKGSFPVIVEYLPAVHEFKSPSSREITYRAFLAKVKTALGAARGKFGAIPSPDGGTLNLNGEQLTQEGREEYTQACADAILLGEPLHPFLWSLIPFLLPLIGSLIDKM